MRVQLFPFIPRAFCPKCRADVRASCSFTPSANVLLFVCPCCGFRFATEPGNAPARRGGVDYSQPIGKVEVPGAEADDDTDDEPDDDDEPAEVRS